MSQVFMRWCLIYVVVTFLNSCTMDKEFVSREQDTQVGNNTNSSRQTRFKVSKVELDVFSGRPNPIWPLTEKEVIILSAMIDTLQKTSPTKPIDNLGYRGFIVHGFDTVTGSVTTIRVYKNTIVYETDNVTHVYFTDVNRQIERFLLATAERYLDRELYSHMKIEVEKD